jgi:hypothetical protein
VRPRGCLPAAVATGTALLITATLAAAILAAFLFLTVARALEPRP